MVERCGSCEHRKDYHDVDGRCWFTVASGLPGANLVCVCLVRGQNGEIVGLR